MSEDKIARRKPPKAQLITLWRGDSYMGLWLPVDGEGGARQTLKEIETCLTTFGNSLPYQEDFMESPLGQTITKVRELQALLPEEAE